SRNWGLFFLFLAGLNEVLRHFFNTANGNFEIWLQAKLWGVTTLSFLFTFSQIPMLLKHGLAVASEPEVEKNPPHD
uniref:septation protein IspZ n=3 Tax=Novosphingobium TaxID=165696 RepID=UPI002618AA85